MKEILINKLIELGYDFGMVNQKLIEWEYLNNSSNMPANDQMPIEVHIENRPTEEIPRILLNVDETIKSSFVLEGNISKHTISSIIAGNIDVIDYPLDKSLCIIAVNEDNKMMIYKYFTSDISYNGKTYESQISVDREQAIEAYFGALSANAKLTEEKVKEVLHMLTQEYIIDKIILENANPRIKIYDDAKEFATNITSYDYKYINRQKNMVKELKKEIKAKIVGSKVNLGYFSNNPYLDIEEANQTPNFHLNKTAYVWLSRNLKSREELAIYASTAMYSARTYSEWLETREDIELVEKANKIAITFSRQVGYQINIKNILEILKKLNREMIILPTEFIKNNLMDSNEEVDVVGYQFSIVSDPNEFEKELYEKVEDYFSGTYRCQMIESLKDNYTMVGKSTQYTDVYGKVVEENILANFNININTAVVKKVILATTEMLTFYTEKNYEMLPLPTMEVIFYFPKVQENKTAKGSELNDFYRPIDNAEIENKMAEVIVSYVSKEGKKIKNEDRFPAWINEKYTPKVEYKITDNEGLMWEYSEMEVPSILVKENEKNEITLVYDKLKQKVKINFVNDRGSKLKDSQEAIYQVGEKIIFDEVERYIDPFGGFWKAKTLDKLNQKVYEEEAKNVINMIYEEETVDVILSFVDEIGNRIMADKIEKFQIGSNFKYGFSKEIIDNSGKSWRCMEEPEEFKIEEGKSYSKTIRCMPLMTTVNVQYVNEEGLEILPTITEEKQIGSMYIPKVARTWQGEDGRHWIVDKEQNKEFKIKKTEEENKIQIKYVPVLVNAIIQYASVDGKEIKRNEVIPAQLGSKWVLNPKPLIKDDKGNEWQLMDKGYKPIIIKENEKENVITFVYQVAMANVIVSYVTSDGKQLKGDDHFAKQIGNAFVPTPEQYIVDKENKRWQLKKVQPAMLKVQPEENKVVITYMPNNANVIWKYIDTDGNELKNDERHMAQIGEKYTPIVSETTILKGANNYKLLNIEPYEITVSENEEENVVRLIYVKV